MQYMPDDRNNEIAALITQGATVSIGLESGQIIAGTVTTKTSAAVGASIVITDSGGKAWHVHTSNIVTVAT